MNSFIKLKYFKEITLEFPNNFNDLIENIKNKFKVDNNELISLQFIFHITNGEKMIIEINDEKQYQYYKSLYENNCESIEVIIGNNYITNSETNKNINEDINKEKSKSRKESIETQEKNINDLKYGFENNNNLDEPIILKKNIDDLNNMLNTEDKGENIKTSLNNTLQLLDNTKKENDNSLSCKYLNNKKIIINKSQILKNYIIEHKILIENTSKNNIEWPIDTFLRCINEDSDIYFYHTDERFKNTINENKDNIYIYRILILFKNYPNIKEGEYSLKYQLINDFYGIIGDDFGNLIIEVIE